MTPGCAKGTGAVIPVVLFAYNRPQHLKRTLECLRLDSVPLIYVFADGPRAAEDGPRVAAVREMLHAVDWCQLVLQERSENLGLGKSILAGVSQILAQHAMAIVFEDDLICVPGTYTYLTTALDRYRDDPVVMSVTGWTHPRVIPADVTDHPYFDGRAESWVWGTWARAWRGMDRDASALTDECRRRWIDVWSYGADLPVMARGELGLNIWAVRWIYWHILNRGLCLRPPWSLVEHVGFDALATNATGGSLWATSPLRSCPPVPREWPRPVEHPECAQLWRAAYPLGPSGPTRLARKIRSLVAGAMRGRPVSR